MAAAHLHRFCTPRIRALLTAALWISCAGAAHAQQTCTSVTFERAGDRPIGRCYADGIKACSADSQCRAHDKDYCVHGVLSTSSTTACNTQSASCLEDIRFRFDKAYACGQFVDGSWWVAADAAGAVTITSITPQHTRGCETGSGACYHGWEVDGAAQEQSLSSRATSLTPRSRSFPYTQSGITRPVSILKGIDNRFQGGCIKDGNCLLHTAVLTLVPEAPPANAFRPPYAGTSKPRYYTTSDLQLDRLPRLSHGRAPSGRTLHDVSAYFSAPFVGMNNRNNKVQNALQLSQSFFADSSTAAAVNGYHAARASRTNDALLRLLLSDADYENNSDHQEALYRAVQHGLDMSGVAKTWSSGNRVRIKSLAIPIAFAATLLGDEEIAQTGFPGFSEVQTFYESANAGGEALWGYTGCTELTYWKRVLGKGDKWCGDPYGYTDQNWFFHDPNTRSSYQSCCSSAPWKGGALLMRLLEVEQVGDIDLGPFLDYTDRWVSRGYHMAPDRCARPTVPVGSCQPPDCPGYGTAWGPAPGNAANCHETGSCQCIPHSGDPMTQGRLSSLHGTSADGGSWRSKYSDAMWDAFRNAASNPPSDDGRPSPPFLFE